ncbi:MAG: hypothetical protein WBP13_03090 [Methylophilaceae bacterium]
MTIYQVLNELNQPVFEDQNFLKAMQEAEQLNMSFEDHYFFVEKAVVQTH